MFERLDNKRLTRGQTAVLRAYFDQPVDEYDLPEKLGCAVRADCCGTNGLVVRNRWVPGTSALQQQFALFRDLVDDEAILVGRWSEKNPEPETAEFAMLIFAARDDLRKKTWRNLRTSSGLWAAALLIFSVFAIAHPSPPGIWIFLVLVVGIVGSYNWFGIARRQFKIANLP